MAVETPASVTRTRSVLERVLKGDLIVHFSQRNEEGFVDPDRPSVEMSEAFYVELGSPENITIAVWPGDRQDLMEQEDFPA